MIDQVYRGRSVLAPQKSVNSVTDTARKLFEACEASGVTWGYLALLPCHIIESRFSRMLGMSMGVREFRPRLVLSNGVTR